MKQQQSITELPPSPDDERRARMIRYALAMSLRMACIIAMLFVQGWWLAVCAVGAIVLPYLAVVVANVSQPKRTPRVLRPGALLPVALPRADADPSADTDLGADADGRQRHDFGAPAGFSETAGPHDDAGGRRTA